MGKIQDFVFDHKNFLSKIRTNEILNQAHWSAVYLSLLFYTKML